ncbi:MAG: sulfatase-like hydrolase/transferase [Myxococcales bacterium]|nr:sulfatase-like hydrolase/transferase [Myxococcales bacterium]
MTPALFLLACGAEVPAPDVAEVLLVTVDTLRGDRLGYVGHPEAKTPHLDALAESGRWFRHATTPLPRTTPALASLHTGLWPHHHGSREVGQPMTHGRTLAEALSDGGWRTLAVSAMRVAGPEHGFDRGFDHFSIDHDVRATMLTQQALKLLDAEVDRPTFLWVHYADPHFPYTPPEDGPLSPEAKGCRDLIADLENKRARRPLVYGNTEGRAQEALADCQQLYDAEVAAVDAAIGTLLEGWRSKRGTDGWVIFSADHGENQGEDGLFYEHGPNVHDASLNVPLVVSGPGVVPGRDDGVARLEDVVPTVLTFAGQAVPEQLDGEPLQPRLAGGEGGPSVAFAESGSALHHVLHDYVVSGRARHHCINGPRFSLCTDKKGKRRLYDHEVDPGQKTDVSAKHPEQIEALTKAAALWPPESARERTARTSRFKLVQKPRLQGGYTTMLFDLTAGETRDVSAEHPEVVAELTAALEEWGAPTPVQAEERSEEELEALRALGYVE